MGLLSYLFKEKGVFIKGLTKQMISVEMEGYERMIERLYKIRFGRMEGKDEIK